MPRQAQACHVAPWASAVGPPARRTSGPRRAARRSARSWSRAATRPWRPTPARCPRSRTPAPARPACTAGSRHARRLLRRAGSRARGAAPGEEGLVPIPCWRWVLRRAPPCLIEALAGLALGVLPRPCSRRLAGAGPVARRGGTTAAVVRSQWLSCWCTPAGSAGPCCAGHPDASGCPSRAHAAVMHWRSLREVGCSIPAPLYLCTCDSKRTASCRSRVFCPEW